MMPTSAATESNNRGYTLAELLIVLAIVALAAAAIGGSFANIGAGRLRSAALDVAEQLKILRTQAVIDAIDVELTARDGNLVSGQAQISAGDASLAIEPASHAAPVIRFLADGSSSGGAVTVSLGDAKERIVIAPVTGRIALDE